MLQPKNRQPSSSTRRRQFTSNLETLEDRRMMAVLSVSNLNDSGPGSLRDAIIEANTDQGADEIIFATGASGELRLTSGELSITDSITITGPGPDALTIDAGNGADGILGTGDGTRIFRIDDGSELTTIDVTLNGLTLTGGDTANGAVGEAGEDALIFVRPTAGATGRNGSDGGAILSFERLIVENSILTGNSTGDGGQGGRGGDGRDGSLFIPDIAAARGGNGGDGGRGGAIAALDGSVTIIDSNLSGNLTGMGGQPGPRGEGRAPATSGSPGRDGQGSELFTEAQVPNIQTPFRHAYSVIDGEVEAGGFTGVQVFEWVSPADGLASVRGGVWNATIPNEIADYWSVRQNEQVLSTTTIVGDEFSEDSPSNFVLGTGGIGSVSDIPVQEGDRLSITLNSAETDLIGINFDVVFNPTSTVGYAVGSIPDRTTVPGEALSFFVTSPDSSNAAVRFELLTQANGPMTLDATTGMFEYTPGPDNNFDVDVLFAYGDAANPLNSQIVSFSPLDPKPEFEFIADQGPIPSSESTDYLAVTETFTQRSESFLFNTRSGPNTRSVSIAGKTVVIEPDHPNGLFERFVNVNDSATQNADISDISIIADKLIIGGHARFPQSDVTIFAKTLEFRDTGESVARIDTTPLSWNEAALQFRNGQNGHDAGNITLNLNEIVLPENSRETRLVLRGGQGQKAGAGRRGTDGTSRTPCNYSEVNDDPRINHDPRNRDPQILDWPSGVVSYVYTEDNVDICNAGVPTDGGAAMSGGRPGNGGDGGNLTSSLLSFPQPAIGGGAAGRPAANIPPSAAGTPRTSVEVKLEEAFGFSPTCITPFGSPCLLTNAVVQRTITTQPGPGWTASFALSGGLGSTSVLPSTNSANWLHPSAIQQVIAHTNDAYLNGNVDFAAETFSNLNLELESLQPFPEEFADRLNIQHAEIASRAKQASDRLDFFGNPQGWAPSLSFAANLQAYEDEIDASIKTLFLSRLVEREAQERAVQISTIQSSLQQLDQLVIESTNSFNNAQALLPELEIELANIENETERIQELIEIREAALTAEAEDRLEPPFWKKTLDFLGPVLQAVPIPVVSAIGSGVVVANSVLSDIQDGDWSGASAEAKKGKKLFPKDLIDKSKDEFKEQREQLKPPSSASGGEIKGYVKDLAKLGASYAPTVIALMNGIKGKEIPADQLEAELAKLKAADSRLTDLVDMVGKLSARKLAFATALSETITTISNAQNQIVSAYTSADGLQTILSQRAEGLRPETVDALRDMERNASSRLLNVQYLTSKAFEYEMLAPYPSELNVTRLVDRVIQLIESGENSGWLDDPANFSTLKALFTEDLRDIGNDILTNLNDTAPRLTATLDYRLSADQVAQLNRGSITFDFLELGLIDPALEDARVLDIGVTSVESALSGPDPQTASVRFQFDQPNTSIIQSDQRRFLFVHPEGVTGRAGWASDYNAITGAPPVRSEISPRDIGSLSIVLGESVASIPSDSDVAARLRSSPSAWSSFELKRFETTVPNAVDVELTAVTITLRLDYQRPVDQVQLLEVRTQQGISPRIDVSLADRTGFSDGVGTFFRYFNTDAQVELTTQPNFGALSFAEWRDEDDNIVGSQPQLSVSMDRSEQIQAIFARPGDADFSGDVGFGDFLRLSSNFGKQVDTIWGDGDFDGNGTVEFADFLSLSANFGRRA